VIRAISVDLIKQGRVSPRPMSALGQKQTYAMQNVMSALPPKADMCSATRYVRFVPIADIRSFDDYIHAPQKCV
jgi:hypothetical protein